MKYANILLLLSLLAACSAHSPPNVLPAAPNDVLLNAIEPQAAVLIYHHPELGPTTPDAMITGPHTGLTSATHIATDPTGRIYVSTLDSIFVFAANAVGDASPIARISGSNTMFSDSIDIEEITADSEGNLYVATYPGKVLEFAAGASGNVAPTHVLSGLPVPAIDIALDPNANLYVVADEHVMEFRRGSWGNATPIRNMYGPTSKLRWPIRLAICGDDTLYVGDIEYPSPAEPPYSVFVYAPGWSSATPPTTIISGHASQVRFPDDLGFY